jgi:hypothetical protein
MPATKPKYLEVEELLSAEFSYIADTATQANEDRATVVSFFLIAVGSPLAAFFSTEVFGIDLKAISLVFSGLFLILAVLGTTTILQLARLRAAWFESMLAMNQLKEFAIEHSEIDLHGAFRWRKTTAPRKFKVNSISFYQALEVSILSGLLFGAFVYFTLQTINPTLPEYTTLLIAVAGAILNTWFQIYLYKRFLD